jgi:hypothetical protein
MTIEWRRYLRKIRFFLAVVGRCVTGPTRDDDPMTPLQIWWRYHCSIPLAWSLATGMHGKDEAVEWKTVGECKRLGLETDVEKLAKVARGAARNSLDIINSLGLTGADRRIKYHELCPFVEWDSLMCDAYDAAYESEAR